MNFPASNSFRVTDPKQILEQMVRIIRAHSKDVGMYATLDLSKFFDLLKNGSYNREPDIWGAQVLARPALTMGKRVPVVACANKAIILSSWAQLNRIPWRLVAVGRRIGKPPHHVYPELFIGGAWRAADPTYPYNVLFAEKSYPVRIVATGLEP